MATSRGDCGPPNHLQPLLPSITLGDLCERVENLSTDMRSRDSDHAPSVHGAPNTDQIAAEANTTAYLMALYLKLQRLYYDTEFAQLRLDKDKSTYFEEIYDIYGKVDALRPTLQPYDVNIVHRHLALARKAKVVLDTFVRNMFGDTTGVNICSTEVKGLGRTLEKAQRKYGGNVRRVLDMARTSLVFDSPQVLYNAWSLICQSTSLQVVRSKNKFLLANATNGYRDVKLNVIFKAQRRHIVEIQLHLRSIYCENRLWRLYEWVRDLPFASTNPKHYIYSSGWSSKVLDKMVGLAESDWERSKVLRPLLLTESGQYNEAEELRRKVLSWTEQKMPDSVAEAVQSRELATLLCCMGKYVETEQLGRHSWRICRQQLGNEHLEVANSCNILGQVLFFQGEYNEAKLLFMSSLAIRKKALGTKHPDVAESLNNLARLMMKQGKYGEAEPLCRDALKIREEALGEVHPDIAESLNSLAELLKAQGKYGEAEQLCRDALKRREEALGKVHPDVAESLNSLAELLRAQGKYDEAEPLYKKSLTIREEALGPEHPEVAQSLNNLAELLKSQGKDNEAEPLYRGANTIVEKALGARQLQRLQYEHLDSNELTWSYLAELGQVKSLQTLYLDDKHLIGSIPWQLGTLTNLKELHLARNQLHGNIPFELGQLQNLIGLNLEKNQLTGPIPPQLGDLSNLTELRLHQNQLTGSIPSELGQLQSLKKLALGANKLTGSIPPQLGNLTYLTVLILTGNELTGSIPLQLGSLSNLERLLLGRNSFTGSIPSGLGQLRSLTQLALDTNKLEGSVPPELGSLSNLRELWLQSNELSGSIPPELGRLSNLKELWLQSNELSGSIPSELEQLRSLQIMDFSKNQLTGSISLQVGSLSNLEKLFLGRNSFTGSIPSGLGELRSLTQLALDNNKLEGSIPPELGRLSILKELWLQSNELSGSIPSKLEQLRSLQIMDFSKNQLTGEIPKELGSLTNLTLLDLRNNQLTGSIPPELGLLQKLEWLYLNSCQLTGSIPKELGQLQQLQELSLRGNQLTGTIPKELGNLTNLAWLSIHDNKLTGSIPPQLGSLSNLTALSLSENQLTGSIPTELGQLQKLAFLYLSNNQLTDNPGDLRGREAVARWQDSLASRRQQIDADRRRSEQAAEALRLQQEADRLRESRAAAAAAAEAERERVAREVAEAEARRKQDLLRQQELQRHREEETRRRDTIEPWLREAGFASDTAAAFAKRFKDEHVATPLAVQSLSRDRILGLARKFGMPENLVDLLVAALDKAVAAERQRVAEESAANTRAAAAERQHLADEAAGSSMGQWLTELGFFGRAGQWSLELSEQELYTPDEVVEMASDEPAALQHVLEEIRMPAVLRIKLKRGINTRMQTLQQESTRRQQQEQDAAAKESSAQERERQLREEAIREEAAARRALEVEAARTSDVAQWLQEGGFSPDLAAELTVRMRESGVGSRRFLQMMPRDTLVSTMPSWRMEEAHQAVFLVLWDQLKQGPQIATGTRTSGLNPEKYGQLMPLLDTGGQSSVFLAPRRHGNAMGAAVIVKRIDAPGQTNVFRREVHILQFLFSQAVFSVPRFEEFQMGSGEGEDLYHYIVMEKGNKNLRRMAEEFPRSARSKREWNSKMYEWVSQMLRVLHDLHKLGVVWGDLKPENFVGAAIEERGRSGELLGVDFGASAVKAGSKAARELSGYPEVLTTLSTAAGQAHTSLYVAPERARHILGASECAADPALDMWALGMVVYWLATGRDYFAGDAANNAAILHRLADASFTVELKETAGVRMPVWCSRLLKRLLQIDPGLRPSVDTARQLLDSGRSSVTTSTVGRTRIVGMLQQTLDRLERLEERSSNQGHALDDIGSQMLKLDGVGRLLQEVVKGELECPKLFVLLPADKRLWQIPQRWFSDRMQLHFLCAYGHPSDQPCNDGEGFTVLQPKEWVKKHAGAVQVSLLVIKLAAGMAVAFATSGLGSAMPVGALFAALKFDALDFDSLDADTAIADLGDLGAKFIVDYIDAAMCEQVDGIGAPSAASSEALRKVREATAHEYRSIVQYLETTHPSWKTKLGDLRKEVALDGEVGWVCGAHAAKWRGSTGLTRRPPAPPRLPAPPPRPQPAPEQHEKPQSDKKLSKKKRGSSCCS